MAKRPQVGDPAPEFELEGTDGTFKLSDHRGERLVLLFYPGDNTPVCTRQFCSYRDRPEDMSGLGATVVGISSQSVDSHNAFSAKLRLNVPLLADLGGKVAKLYGASRGPLGTKRAVVILDEAGVIRYRHDHTFGLDYQTADDLAEALAAIPATA